MTQEVTPCPQCGADNEVHRLFCLRCAAELVPDAAAELEPPRARGRMARSLSPVDTGIHQRWDDFFHRVCQAAPRVADLVRSARLALLIAASILPGLAHLLLGRGRAGLGLLAAFLAAAGLWLAFMGSLPGALAAFCAVSLIGSSVLDVLRMGPTGERPRTSIRGRDVLMAAAIVGFVYAGAIWAASAVWQRVVINQPILRLNPETARGDVAFPAGDRLLIARRAYRSQSPSRGDVVLASVDGMPSVQRVLAVPGDVLETEDGLIYLNGEPVPTEAYPFQPENPVEIEAGRLVRQSASIRVRPGRLVVWAVQAQHEDVWLGPEEIGERAVDGKAWAVYSPYRHRRVIDHHDPVPKQGEEDGTAGS